MTSGHFLKGCFPPPRGYQPSPRSQIPGITYSVSMLGVHRLQQTQDSSTSELFFRPYTIGMVVSYVKCRTSSPMNIHTKPHPNLLRRPSFSDRSPSLLETQNISKKLKSYPHPAGHRPSKYAQREKNRRNRGVGRNAPVIWNRPNTHQKVKAQ